MTSHFLPFPTNDPFEWEAEQNAARKLPTLDGLITAVPLRLSAKSCRVPPGSFGHSPLHIFHNACGDLANFLHVFSLSVAAVHEPNMDQEQRRNHGNVPHKRGGTSAHV